MNSRIPLNRIAELTAISTDSDNAVCLQFIKDLFSIVEEEVSCGNEVEIPGLGIFAKSGEIDEPISFIPDEDFAGRLNEAFAMFSPVELHDGVTEKELSEADIPEDTESVIEPKLTGIAESSESPSGSLECQDTTDRPAESQSEPEIDHEREEKVTESVESVDMPDPQEMTEPKEEQIPEDASSGVALPEPTGEENSETVSLEELDSVIATDEIELPDAIVDLKPEPSSDDEIPEEEMEYVVVRKSKSRFWLGLILGLLLGFAAGVISFLAYIVKILDIQVENVFPF